VATEVMAAPTSRKIREKWGTLSERNGVPSARLGALPVVEMFFRHSLV
jgi:hypothetical protein